jgi:hypothetical protein
MGTRSPLLCKAPCMCSISQKIVFTSLLILGDRGRAEALSAWDSTPNIDRGSAQPGLYVLLILGFVRLESDRPSGGFTILLVVPRESCTADKSFRMPSSGGCFQS